MLSIVLILVAIFLAINMGTSGFAIAFTPSCGSKILKLNKAVVLYSVFVLAGAVLIGPKVVDTLTGKIIQQGVITDRFSGLIILISAAIMMFIANLLKIPQSTSFITVSAFAGAGVFYYNLNYEILLRIFSFAVIFSFLAYIVTFLIARIYYPPRNSNLYLYEKSFIHQNKLKNFIVYSNCYSAFAIGTNNVANVVSPVLIAISVNPTIAILLAAPFFGLGGYIIGKGVLKTISKDIVPIGEISAGVLSFVTASFVILASILGLPTPYVQFTTFSILAISTLKDGFSNTMKKSVVKKILFVWIIIPVLTGSLSFVLHHLFLR